MTKQAKRMVTLVLVWGLTFACGRPVDPPDTGSAGEAQDDGLDMSPDLPVDHRHCGEANINCVGPLQIGACVDGECQGKLFNCWTNGTTCAVACAAEPGAMCAEAACEGATAFGWNQSGGYDESVVACDYAWAETAMPIDVACDEQLPFDEFPAIRCCCKW